MAINEFNSSIKKSKPTWKSSSKTTPKNLGGLQTQLYVSEIEKLQSFQEVDIHLGVHSATPSLSPKHARKVSSSPVRFTSSRLSYARAPLEKFNYEVISIKDEERDDSDDEKGNELDSPHLEQNKNYLGFVKRKFSLKIETEFENRGLLPRFTFKSNSRFCDRAIYLKNSDIPKHFCDILGPRMCSDCTKARRKQANIDDSVESFPEISVSPYQLCVPPDDDLGKPRTPTKVFKDCDVLFRRRSVMSRFSSQSPQNGPTTGCPARPNSTTGEIDQLESCASSPTLSYVSGQYRGLGTPNSLSSPEPSSGRSSVARYIDSKNDWKHSKNPHESEDVQTKISVKVTRSAKSRGPKPSLARHPSDLHQNVFHKAISARMRGARSSSRTPTIERRGKLSEVPYWRFLIPEPPIMQVGTMNVSIYTPKGLPGIKIFDESLFDI